MHYKYILKLYWKILLLSVIMNFYHMNSHVGPLKVMYCFYEYIVLDIHYHRMYLL